MENLPQPGSVARAKEQIAQLKRIADALERIADELEARAAPKGDSSPPVRKR